MTTACPSCGKQFAISPAHHGKSVICPFCQAKVQIPLAIATAITDAPPRRSDAEIEPSRAYAVFVVAVVGLAISPFLMSPLAWYFASRDLVQMEQGAMDRSGRGITQISRVLGICGTIAAALILALACVFGFVGGLLQSRRPQF